MPSTGPTSPWQRLAREPLLHFLALGLALYALHTWRSPREARPDASRAGATTATTARAPIVVDADTRARVQALAERRLGRIPTTGELDLAIEDWIDQEILYREGLERGLEQDDPMIRDRVASRMAFVLEQAVLVPEPDEAELRAWFVAHRERWTVPERLDFTHVFVAGDDDTASRRVRQLTAALAAGAAPERLGDRFGGGHRYRGRRLDDLATAFGHQFAAGLDEQPPGVWVERSSRFGRHLVRVDRVDRGRTADYQTARLDVRRAWRDAHRDAELARAVAEVRAGWEIVRP